MALPKRLIAEIFTSLGRAVERDDLEMLRKVHDVLAPHLDKQGAGRRVRVEMQPSPHGRESKSRGRVASGLREELSNFESREALSAHLREKYPKKIDIVGTAREIRVAIVKDENYDDLVEKVIDATIGYKIRSRAIRGGPDPSEG